jgi:NADH-quinone oxidoreductase subunit M
MIPDSFYLPALVLFPVVGGFFCWQSERIGRGAPRWIAFFSMLGVVVLSLYLWAHGDYNFETKAVAGRWHYEVSWPWIPMLGINLHLGLDGLSLLMVVLTGGLGLAAVVCSWREIQRHVGFFYLNLLWNLGGVLGIFLALDMFMFFFFWELMIIPMYFLIVLWGHEAEADGGKAGKGRTYAANKFFLFTQTSGLLLLISILSLVFLHYFNNGTLTFDYDTLLSADNKLKPAHEMLLMLGFFAAFAVKLPVVPLHSWLPDAHAQAPTAGSVDLAGILLKTAAYGLLRFALPFFPNASATFAPIAMTLGAIGIFYGAIMACAQTDIKRLVAYTSVSHMGFILIGIYAGTLISLQGVVVQMLAHGISAGALFIVCGEMYERLHTRDLRRMGGLWSRMAWLPAISLFFAAASLGLPGLGNFVGEFLILLGAYPISPWLVSIATGGLILAVVYSLWMIQKAFYGESSQGASAATVMLEALTLRERGLLLLLMVILLALGVYPQPVLELSEGSVRTILETYSAVAR